MSRMRNIKPNLFEDEDLATLPIEASILFIGLWTIADREGRLQDRPKWIKAKVFPYRPETDVDVLLAGLTEKNFLIRYEIEGKKYIQIRTFSKHQRPHIKEAKSEIPPPPPVKALTKVGASTNLGSTKEGVRHDQGDVEPAGNLELENGEWELENGDIITSADADSSPQVKTPELTHEAVKDLYHEHCPSFPRVSKMTARRIAAVKARIEEHPKPEFWIALLKRVEASDFLSRRAPPREGHENFRADFEWIVNVNNFTKILEGKYDNRGQRKAGNIGNHSGLAERARQIAGYLDDDEDPFSTGEKECHLNSGNCAETSNREMPNRLDNVFSEHGNHEGEGPNLQSCA